MSSTSIPDMQRQSSGLRQIGGKPAQQQPASQQQPSAGAPQTAAPAPSASQGLPPTGLQQQLTSMNEMYAAVGQAPAGFSVRQSQLGNTGLPSSPSTSGGQTSLDQLARNLATQYGLPIGKGRLVDENGNLLMSPEQLSQASGGKVTLGEAAAKMNYVAQAISDQQKREQTQKGIAALQTGMGLVQSRGRGSLASMQSGFYQGLAQMYESSKGDYEAADFSYFIQKEQQDIASDLMRRQEKLLKKQSQMQFAEGLGVAVVGLFTGNYAAAAGGAAMAAGSASSTGWF